MRLLGFDITRAKAAPANLTTVHDRGNWWWPIVREPFAGAWQKNKELSRETILAYSAVYACVTLIASDIAKIGLRLVEQDGDGIWSTTESSAFSPVLRKPNQFQNKIKFIEQWVISKLIHGNTYVFLERDNRQVVVAMYVLDALRCKPLVAPNGDVYYDLRKDNIAGIEPDALIVPASEIIHDVMVPLYHPLCGVSPITACGLAASQGLAIQNNSTKFFENGAQPGGILTSPHTIPDTTAERLKKEWNERYSGQNAGKTAVLGDGLEYKPISVTSRDSQLIEQLKWSAETVCSCFHVPPYMIGVGPMPTYNNIEALNQQYYTQCLQSLIESIEALLDDGLGLSKVPNRMLGTEFDLDDLLRMDTATKVKTVADGIGAGFLMPNEGRKKFDLKPVVGGDTPYLQQQNFSLSALAKRDALDDPFGTAKPPAAVALDDGDAAEGDDDESAAIDAKSFADHLIAKANAIAA